MPIDDVKSYVTSAISYWEIRRIIYNAVLGGIVIGYFVANLPTLLQLITRTRSLRYSSWPFSPISPIVPPTWPTLLRRCRHSEMCGCVLDRSCS